MAGRKSAIGPGLLTAGLLLLAGSLAGCGFKPLYGNVPGSVTSAELAAVDIGLIPDRSGQILRNRLVTRMQPRGPAAETLYILDVDLNESSVGLAVETDETATRTNLTITATVALTDIENGDVVFVDTLRSYASYDVLTAEYATLVAERDARERVLVDLADRVATSVALYLQRSD